MVPERTCVPPAKMRLPLAPLITPAKVSAPLLMVRVLLPRTAEPELLPDRLMMEAPEVVPLISKLALLMMLLELAIEPVPVKDRVPADMVVVPV